ncbi:MULTISPECIES: DUF3017 domain-containing protein [Actinopolyspora]|uniref:DUF3017 domain-containing protein n=1 Tax=Actinopolyspora saharensis TaxID=995062 RepID=A0A1H1GR57_9ACTN|nr:MULTISPECIES: DUF3017 domain-containing protein [Actinopolyspora]NHD16733.1 DUF3017 domain-containing protein [Actinopolyspora sp. BKK2]NHE75404.1 DUF3017 domain-containing protein [Actinopolyspora sp. BKK1]SDR15665.1 Protein of unknown function [Actinopolyspora saharensis]
MFDRFVGGRGSVHLWFALVVLVALLGLLRVAMSHWRDGATLLGGAFLLAAVFRAGLSSERVGLLAIRSRPVDVVLYGALGAVIVFVAVTIKGGPLAG